MAASQARLKQRARPAYQGEDLAGITLVLNGLFGGDGAKTNATQTIPRCGG